MKRIILDKIINEALTKGVEMHLAGQFDLARKLYSSVTKLELHQADANHNMGLLKMDTFQPKTIVFNQQQH